MINPSSIMKKFLLNQYRNFQTTKAIFENFKVPPTINIPQESLTRQYSFFFRKHKTTPIKCKIRTNECGQKVAEPYIAKKPSSITIPSLSKDFTMNPEETCTRLQEEIVTYSPPPPEIMTSKTNLPCPNALTKYLKTKRGCEEVYRGVEPHDCKKKPSCSKVKEATYTGKDCPQEDQTKRKPRRILEDLVSKLKSKRLIKPSGFLDEDLIKEACDRLKARGTCEEFLTCVRNTSKLKTSLEYQNSCGGEFDANKPFEGGMSKAAKTKKVEGEDEPHKVKPKNNPKGKSGVRRGRRRPRWFSRIPMEPNVKGSVIFANGSEQVLDDPCKILSVNFSASNLHSIEGPNEVNHYDYVVEKLRANCKKEDHSKAGVAPLEEDVIYNGKAEEKEAHLEPVVRQKKISKLDNTVKCLTTTVLPKNTQTKRKQKRVKKHSKSFLKQVSSDSLNLNASLLDLNNFPSDAFGGGYHAMTTNNLLIHFKKEGNYLDLLRKEVVKSDSSIIKIKDVTPIYESGDEKEVQKGKLSSNMSTEGLKKDLPLLPGLTRPVTQKPAHLNLLESKARKKNPGDGKGVGGGKTKEKSDRKKVMGSTTKPETLEIKGVNHQQFRMKSTEKSALSWRTKCGVERRPCPTQKKNYDEKADAMYPLPNDWEYEERVPKEIARKWSTWECPREKDQGCPVTSEDLKKGVSYKKPTSAAAINRCNLEECKNRLRCRRPVSKCRNVRGTVKPLGPGK